MLDAVIFDMDGLLFDTEKLCMKMWKAQAEKEGLVFSDKLFYSCIGRNNNDTKKIVTESFGNYFSYEDFHRKTSRAVREEIEKNGPPKKKGLNELFDFLKQNKIVLALATSTSRESATWMIKKAGIFEYFTAFAFGNEVEHGKPAPDIFLHAAHQLNVDPSNCVVYEDSEAGLKAAYSAGIKSIFIKDLIEPSADVLKTVWNRAESLDNSIEILRTLF